MIGKLKSKKATSKGRKLDLNLAEKMLELANDRLQLVQNATGAGIWDWDIVNNKFYWSDQFLGRFLA